MAKTLRQLPKLPEDHYYVVGTMTPTMRLKRNKEAAVEVATYATTVDAWVNKLQDTYRDDAAYITKADLSTIVDSIYGVSRTLFSVSELLQLNHDLDAGIAVPLPDGLTFADVEIEGEGDE